MDRTNTSDRGADQSSQQTAQHATSAPTTPQQNASAQTSSRPEGRSAAGQTRSDEQRPIQTNREESANQSTGVSRRQSAAPSPYGSIANPFLVMRRMAEDMDRLFSEFNFGRSMAGMSPLFGNSALRGSDRNPRRGIEQGQTEWTPQLETFRRGDQLVVRADLPGLEKDDVHVEIDDGMLAISGERSEENHEDRDDYYRSERSYGQFYRAIPLPDGVTGEQCDATFKDGVLEVTLAAPKQQEQKKPRQVQIR